MEPYRFNVNITVEELDNRVFEMGTSDGLDVVCSGNTLEIQFVEDLSDGTGKLDNTDRAYFDKLLGRNFNLTISGVWDLRRNVMEPYSEILRFIHGDLHPGRLQVQILHSTHFFFSFLLSFHVLAACPASVNDAP